MSFRKKMVGGPNSLNMQTNNITIVQFIQEKTETQQKKNEKQV